MAKRGTFYRCHLFSYAGPQTEGVNSYWARNLEAIGEREVLSGTYVELYVRIEGSAARLTSESRLRFDILEEDFLLTGGLDDMVDSLVGTGASAPAGFHALPRVVEFVELGENESVDDQLDYLRRTRGDEYRERIYVFREPGEAPVFHILAFWLAERREDYLNAEFYFIWDADEEVDDQSEKVLLVTSRRGAAPQPGVALEDVPIPIPRDLLLEQQADIAVRTDFEWEQSLLASGGIPPGPAEPPEGGSAAELSSRVRQPQPLPPPPPPRLPVLEQQPGWPRPHPQLLVEHDRVVLGPSPFDGHVVAIFRRWEDLRPTSLRYAVSAEFNRAIRWGQLLFGGQSFVVIEGPLVGEGEVRYFVLRFNREFALGQIRTRFVGVDIRYWQLEQRDPEMKTYVVRLIGTSDDAIVIPNYPIYVHEVEQQLLGGFPFETANLADVIPRERAVDAVFAEIDRGLPRGDNEAAVRMLLDLNHNAFALLSPAKRGEYLGFLLRSSTLTERLFGGGRMENSFLAIVRSVQTPNELAEVLRELRVRTRVREIVDKLDRKLWAFLGDLGKRFGDEFSITVDFAFVVSLFRESIAENPPLLPPGLRIRIRSDGSVDLDLAILDTILDAANSFLRFGRSFVEGIWTLISEPDKVAVGLYKLAEAVVMIYASTQIPPSPAALRYVRDELVPQLQRLVRELIDAWKGAQVLARALGEEGPQTIVRVIERVKWAIVWEVASMFIGAGEINAAIKAVSRGVEEAAGLARVMRAVEAGEQVAGKLDDFARLAGRSGLVEAENAGRLVTHLPPEDLRLLQRTLAEAEPRTFRSVEALGEHLGESGSRALQHVTDRMRVLEMLEQRVPGTLATNGEEALRRLTNLPGVSNQEILRGLNALGPRETSRLVQTLLELPAEAAAPGGRLVSFATAQQIAMRETSFGHLLTEGYETFSGVLRQSAGDLHHLDRNFEALGLLRRGLSDEAAQAALTRRVAAGEAAALEELRSARQALDVMKGRCLF